MGISLPIVSPHSLSNKRRDNGPQQISPHHHHFFPPLIHLNRGTFPNFSNLSCPSFLTLIVPIPVPIPIPITLYNNNNKRNHPRIIPNNIRIINNKRNNPSIITNNTTRSPSQGLKGGGNQHDCHHEKNPRFHDCFREKN